MSSRLAQSRSGRHVEQVLPAFTHKTNHDEVLLRSWRQVAPDTFAVTARWPQTHSFYQNRHGLHDPLLLSETVRQTFPLLAHRAYRVPLGHQLLWRDFSWDLDDPDASYATGCPVELDLRIACHDVTYRQGRATAVSMTVDVARDGHPMATARSRFAIKNRAVYNRLRGRYADAVAATARAIPPPPPADPLPAGRGRPADVVISATDRTNWWQLRVDTSHPILFDHPVDHAPGMLLLEAARQAALTTAHPRPVVLAGMESVFLRYAELDAPCWLKAETFGNARRVRVGAWQHDREIFTSFVTLVPARVVCLAA